MHVTEELYTNETTTRMDTSYLDRYAQRLKNIIYEQDNEEDANELFGQGMLNTLIIY
jgi:hypothetical protein